MAETKSDVSLKKGLPWLKRLQGALDDDDSSDSSSQPTKITYEKVVRKKKKKPEKEGEGRRRVTKRLRRQEGKKSNGEASEFRNVVKETHCRLLNKNDKTGTLARRKRFVTAAKEEQSKELIKTDPSSLLAVNSAAMREQWKQKLHVRRATVRENDKIAITVTQDESSETLQEKTISCGRATRLKRNEKKIPAGKEADLEVNNERRRRSSLRLTVGKNSTDKFAAKLNQRKTADSSTINNKIEHPDPPIVSIGDVPDSLKQFEDEDDEARPGSVAKAAPAEPTKNDGKQEELMTTTELIEQNDHDEVFFAVIKTETNKLLKPEHNGEPESTPLKLEKAEIDVKAKVKTSQKPQKYFLSPEKPEKAGAAQKSLVAVMTPSVTLGDPVKREFLHEMKIEPHVDEKAAPKLLKEERNDERQAESPMVTQNAKGSVKMEDGVEKNSSEEKGKDLVLEMMPIPRRMMKAGHSTALSTTGSFVIPKRSFANVKQAERTAVAQDSRARTGESQATIDKNSLDPPKPVNTLSLPSPGSSPMLSKVIDCIPSNTTRYKKPVPVKTASISMADRALMRLSRKRNSIFMAAMELATQAPDFRSNKGQMMGYEVYDVEEKSLPDLIPRLSCATKREMASNRELYTTSHFGVSLPTPKAIGKASSTIIECGNNDVISRELSCYEELQFNRSEDRDFYQQRMYGTAFVPQKLRGWITLMARDVRFERKSTGIRFNQDRDREEFAASLSKRYALNKSVPRCDIPRENWHKLMRNQPGSVYLHYYNREDAEQASHIFRDDLGNPLELKLNLKAGVVIRASSVSAVGPRSQRTPLRSPSSERSVPKSSLLSSQNGSARNSSSWRGERLPLSTSDNRYRRYDRGGPYFRGERRYNKFDSESKRSRAMVECGSRSRSRSKSFHGWQNGFDAHEGRADPVSDARERTDSRNEKLSRAVHSDAETPARKRARSPPRSPRRSPTFDLNASKREFKIDDDQRGQEDGEVASRSEANPARTPSEHDRRSGVHRARSPSRRWQQKPSNTEVSQRRDHFSDNLCVRSRSPATRHRFNQQWSNWNTDNRRSRFRSRPQTLPTQSERKGDHSDQYNGHRGIRKFERACDDSTLERPIHINRGRGDYNDRRGGSSRQ